MLNNKELTSIILITLILAITISLIESLEIFLYTLLIIFAIILINTISKKIASYYLDSKIEIKSWSLKRYGFRPEASFKKAFPAGPFLPIITTAFSAGYLVWMACLTFEPKPKIYRAAKRHGLYSFSEMTEYHIGLIAAAGIFTNLVFAVIGYLLNFPEFAKLNIYYAFYNLLPLSDLDGNKIFFGSLILWSFLASIVLIGMFFALFII